MRAQIIILSILGLPLCGCETLSHSSAPVTDLNNKAALMEEPVKEVQCNGHPMAQYNPLLFNNEDVIMEIQARLILLGYSTGQIDGVYGKKTEQGIRNYQAANHLLTDGRPTPELLEHIRSTQRTRGVNLSRITPQVIGQTAE